MRRLLLPTSNVVLRTKRSVIEVEPEGTPPSQTLGTVVIPVTLMKVPSVATPVILLKVGIDCPALL